VERLKQDLARIKRDMNHAYRDRLDGRISEEFWGKCSAQREAERQRITERLARHEKVDSAYFDLGVRLVDVAGRAAERTRSTVCWSAGASCPRSFRTSP
jgi:hypothetical protein